MTSQNKRWQALVARNQFDEDRARVSLMTQTKMIDEIEPRNLRQAASRFTPSLGTLNKYRGRETAIAAVAYTLIYIDAYFNLPLDRKLTEMQRDFIGEMLLIEYPWLTIADVKLCVKWAALGKFGEVYARIDAQVVMTWFLKYNDIRAESAEIKAMRQHEQRKRDDKENARRSGRTLSFQELSALAAESNHQLLLKKAKVIVESPKRSNWKYRSISEYCHAHELNVKEFLQPYVEQWDLIYIEEKRNDIELTKEKFAEMQLALLLHKLNKESSHDEEE